MSSVNLDLVATLECYEGQHPVVCAGKAYWTHFIDAHGNDLASFMYACEKDRDADILEITAADYAKP